MDKKVAERTSRKTSKRPGVSRGGRARTEVTRFRKSEWLNSKKKTEWRQDTANAKTGNVALHGVEASKLICLFEKEVVHRTSF